MPDDGLIDKRKSSVQICSFFFFGKLVLSLIRMLLEPVFNTQHALFLIGFLLK